MKSEAIALLLESILSEAKQVAYDGNVSLEDLKFIIEPLSDAFRQLSTIKSKK